MCELIPEIKKEVSLTKLDMFFGLFWSICIVSFIFFLIIEILRCIEAIGQR